MATTIPKLPERIPSQETKVLHDVFTPLCEDAVRFAEPERIKTHDAEILDAIDNASAHNLPTDYSLTRLPPDMFVDIDRDTLHDVKSRIHEGEDVVGDIYDAWLVRHPETSSSYSDFYDLYDVVQRPDFDVDHCIDYTNDLESRSAEELNHIKDVQVMRRNNVGKWDQLSHPMEQVDRFIHITNETIPALPVISEVAMPVGEYGKEFADDLLRTTALMQGVAHKNLRPKAAELTEGNESSLQLTARVENGETPTADTTMVSMQEGILSVGQTLAILTLEKVDGYDDPSLLLRDIVGAGIVSRLARYSPMGFVGPMALSGKHFRRALQRGENGLQLGEAFEAYLKEQKAAYIGKIAAEHADIVAGNIILDDAVHQNGLARMCPVADVSGGIDILAHRFVDLVDVRRQLRQDALALVA